MFYESLGRLSAFPSACDNLAPYLFKFCTEPWQNQQSKHNIPMLFCWPPCKSEENCPYVLPLVSNQRAVAQEVLKREGIDVRPCGWAVPGHFKSAWVVENGSGHHLLWRIWFHCGSTRTLSEFSSCLHSVLIAALGTALLWYELLLRISANKQHKKKHSVIEKTGGNMHKTMASKCPSSRWAENLFDIRRTSSGASALQRVSRKSLGQKHLWMHAILSGLPHWAEVYEKWAARNSVVILFLPPHGGWGSQCLLCGLASHTQTHTRTKRCPEPWG